MKLNWKILRRRYPRAYSKYIFDMKKILLFIILISFAAPSFAEDKTESNLPVPRFVSIKSKEANVRSGPGKRYPIKWVYERKDLPVEIVEEYEFWRKIRDIQGDEGWIHKSQLSGYRAAIVKVNGSKLYDNASIKSTVEAVLENGVIIKIDACEEGFCHAEASEVDGYIEVNNIWGVYFGEEF